MHFFFMFLLNKNYLLNITIFLNIIKKKTKIPGFEPVKIKINIVLYMYDL